jgi:hypothetical protein
MKQEQKDLYQSMGTILALVISIIAMVTSIYEANILKAQQKSMVWPYLDVGIEYDSQGFSAKVYNNGSGPAIVHSLEIRIDNKPVKDIFDLVNTLLPDNSLGYDVLRQSKVNKYVFRPSQEVELLGFTWTPETRALVKEVESRVQIIIGYESVLGDQWIYDSKNEKHREGAFKASVEYDN